MSNAELLEDELDDGTEGGVDVNELRLRLYPLDVLRGLTTLNERQCQEQIHYWFENYDQVWNKHNTEFIFDHLVRDMSKLGVNYQSTFITDTTAFFTVIAKDSGEHGGATLNKVWAERRIEPMVSVVHQAREQAYGWLNQREALPGRHTLATHVHNYFTVQHTFIKQLHWTALVLGSLKRYWPLDNRVTRIDALMAGLTAIDFSLRNPNRAHQVGSVTRELQSL